MTIDDAEPGLLGTGTMTSTPLARTRNRLSTGDPGTPSRRNLTTPVGHGGAIETDHPDGRAGKRDLAGIEHDAAHDDPRSGLDAQRQQDGLVHPLDPLASKPTRAARTTAGPRRRARSRSPPAAARPGPRCRVAPWPRTPGRAAIGGRRQDPPPTSSRGNEARVAGADGPRPGTGVAARPPASRR